MLDDKLKKILAYSGVGLLGLSASATFLYFLLKSDNEEENFRSKILSGSRQTTIRVPVPKDVVGAIIGRQGSVIKSLQEKTNTRIRFDDKSPIEDAERILVIRGSPEAAQEAETLIRALIVEQPEIFAEEIFIPVRACGRIIGKNGDNIRHMSYVSKAKIIVDRSGNDRDPDNMKRVTIRGARDEIDMAIHMIDEKLAEEEAFRQKIELSSAGRPSRYRGKPLSIEASSTDGAKSSDDSRMQEKLIPTAADGFLEVYISAVNSAGHFWVQLVGIKAIELDKLVEDMTDFYNDSSNRDLLRVSSEVSVGSIVAAPFAPDKCWYRGRVVSVEDDDYDSSQSKVSVHYVDFGDAVVLQRHSLCQMKTDFMVVPFQGIECQLANVKPIDGQQWSSESTDMFEVLTYSSQWKVMMAKPLAYLNKESGSVAVVELVDTTGHKDVNVAEELVKRKYAVWDKA